MATRVYEAGPARTYGSAWSTAGQAINEGLGTVLGYYQEYQRQKRFEQQQQQEARIKAQEMAERKEMNDLQKKRYQAEMDAAEVQNLERMAMLTPQAPDEFTTTTPTMATDVGIKDQGAEFGGPLASEIQVGEKKTPMRTKRVGAYTAVLDWGGEQARKAKEAAEQADWVTLQQDVDLGKLGVHKAGTKIPPALAALIEKPVKPETQVLNGALYERQSDGSWKSVAREAKQTDGVAGGSYKAVYDKQAKEDVMANDAMIAANPARYGPAKKSEGGGKPPLAGEVTKMTELQQGMSGIGDLRKAISGQGNTGLVSRFAAWVPGVTQITGWGADAKSRNATIKLVKQIIGKGLEGGVLRKEDEAKYADILPTIGDATEVAIAKVNKLEQRLMDNYEIQVDMLERAGRDVSKFQGLLPGRKNVQKTDPLGLGL